MSKTDIKNFKTFLSERYVPKNNSDGKIVNFLANSSLFNGSYQVLPEDMNPFFELYSKAAIALEKSGMYLGMLETPTKESSIIKIDLDIEQSGPERQVTLEMIQNLVQIYNEILLKETSVKPDDLNAFVFMRSGPYEKPKKNGEISYRDGVHILYPSFRLPYDYLHHLRNQVLVKMDLMKVFHSLENFKSSDELLDKAVVEKNSWYLYKSTKKDTGCYEMVAVYDSDMDDVIDQYSNMPLLNLVKHLSLQTMKKDITVNVQIPKNQPAKAISKKSMASSKIASSPGEASSSTDNGASSRNLSADANQPEDSQVKGRIRNETFHKIERLVMECMRDDRANIHEEWIQMCWCLASIENTERMLNLFIEFKKKCPEKFDEDRCRTEWDLFLKKSANVNQKKLSIGSIYYWAKMDNPEKFKEISESFQETTLIEKCLNEWNHYNLANLLHHEFQYEYVCASARNKTWYEFKNEKWHEVYNGLSLKKRISEDLYQVISKYIDSSLTKIRMDDLAAAEVEVENAVVEVQSEQPAAEDGKKAAKPKKKAGDAKEKPKNPRLETLLAAKKQLIRLGDSSFKENIIKEAMGFFYDPNFESMLDSNTNLIGFSNGVYDLSSGLFRSTSPIDAVSMCTKIAYPIDTPAFEMNQAIDVLYEDLITKIFPNPNVREYALTFLASCLDGASNEQKFHIFTGSGSNGKSFFIDFFESCVGDYAGKLPSSLLTQKRGHSSNATPELSRTKGKRFVSIQEPDEGASINSGLMKELSGGDKIYIRSLYKDGGEFKPQFNIAMCCNFLPKINTTDGGTWRRVRVVEFISKFVDDIKNSGDTYGHTHVFQKDKTLAKRCNDLRSAFVYLLINKYYPIYKEHGLREIDEIMELTRLYKEENDIYLQFFKDKIRVNQSEEILVVDAYRTFGNWYTDNYPETKAPPRKEFIKFMQTKMGNPIGNKKWKGFELSYEIVNHGNDIFD